LGNAAAGAAKTYTFLGERYRRRGSKRATVALGRSILVITWHLLSDPAGPGGPCGPAWPCWLQFKAVEPFGQLADASMTLTLPAL
jgi:hypothetical protein